MSDKPRESFLVPEPVAYCYETPLHGWEIASRAAVSAEPELRWRAMVMLTDAEREAIGRASDTLRYLQADYGKTQTEQDAATLRGLRERTT